MSDKELITNYLKGDEKSFELLVAKYLKPIYGFAYRRTGNVADAEDITQEVFVRVWRNLKKFDLKKAFKPWLFTIAKNTSIDFLRKKKSIPFSWFGNKNGYNPLLNKLAAPTGSIENKRLLDTAVESLSPKHRMVINYRHKDELTFAEIAQSLGESINTVKSRYRRALQKLKKLI